MANILALKRRIQTAQNVSKTTRAMQMIATSKLKKAQNAALASKAYVEKLTALTQGISSKVPENEKNEYMKSKNSEKKLIIAISPDKGLCGGLITNLTKELIMQSTQEKNLEFITIGKKLETGTIKTGNEISASFEFGTTLPIFDAVYPIMKFIDEKFLNSDVSEVKVLYSNFMTVFTQVPKTETLLPVNLSYEEENKKQENEFMLFEPNASEILPIILRHFLEMKIYQYLLESYASEQAARMVAMKNATENAEEIIDFLKLEYNKQRQEKITSEILDIGSGMSLQAYE